MCLLFCAFVLIRGDLPENCKAVPYLAFKNLSHFLASSLSSSRAQNLVRVQFFSNLRCCSVLLRKSVLVYTECALYFCFCTRSYQEKDFREHLTTWSCGQSMWGLVCIVGSREFQDLFSAGDWRALFKVLSRDIWRLANF